LGYYLDIKAFKYIVREVFYDRILNDEINVNIDIA